MEYLEIKAIIILKGLTQAVLAREAGVSETAISRVVQKKDVSRRLQELIARRTGVPFEEMCLLDIGLRLSACADAVDEIGEVEVYYAPEFVLSGGRDDGAALSGPGVAFEDLPSAAVSSEAHQALCSADFCFCGAMLPVGELCFVCQVDDSVHVWCF